MSCADNTCVPGIGAPDVSYSRTDPDEDAVGLDDPPHTRYVTWYESRWQWADGRAPTDMNTRRRGYEKGSNDTQPNVSNARRGGGARV